MILSYLNISNFLIMSFCIGFMLLGSSLVFRLRTRIDREKSSIYECGFIPFSETRFQFEIQFYAIAILFLLFDIEVLYLYPYSMNYSILQPSTHFVMFLFLIILIVGLIYELRTNILDFFEKSKNDE